MNTKELGNIRDIATIEVEEIGGVPVRELQRSIRDLQPRITGFVQPADPSNPLDLMPPNAPAVPNWEGNRLGPPAFLEDLEVELEVGKMRGRGRRGKRGQAGRRVPAEPSSPAPVDNAPPGLASLGALGGPMHWGAAGSGILSCFELFHPCCPCSPGGDSLAARCPTCRMTLWGC